MHSVSIGARQAIAECQWQFRLERWNCTPVRTPNESISDIFATTLKSGRPYQATTQSQCALFVANVHQSFVVRLTAADDEI
ncbi:hypothetical protein D918_04585 [Trichuris suis]|nr:hypothetical protein D918_04585 [Trichuris suis]